MTSNDSHGTALITGASSGIGLELARLFARDRTDLVLVARREADLQKLAEELASSHPIQVRVLPADLSDPAAPDHILEALRNDGIVIDSLVNNAGAGTYGPFVETDLEAELQMLRLNIVSLTHLTKLFAREMVARHKGRILNVASTAAFQPGPLMAVYYATKAYVLSFTEALAAELQGSGVTVTALCPGPTRTGFQGAAKMEKSRLVSGLLSMQDAATVAKVGYKAMMRGSRIAVPGIVNRLLAQSIRFTPRRLVTIIVYQMQKSKS
ncbi:MAG: SDR family oxidoreductase [Acidobacteria bacterium]|nr:SDR family oxidoreductase [Acidobacteriota bacterium]